MKSTNEDKKAKRPSKRARKIGVVEDETQKEKPIEFKEDSQDNEEKLGDSPARKQAGWSSGDNKTEKIKENLRDQVVNVLFDSLVDKDIGAITTQSLQKTLIELGVAKYLPESRINELIETFADGVHGENPTISKEGMAKLFNVEVLCFSFPNLLYLLPLFHSILLFLSV